MRDKTVIGYLELGSGEGEWRWKRQRKSGKTEDRRKKKTGVPGFRRRHVGMGGFSF